MAEFAVHPVWVTYREVPGLAKERLGVFTNEAVAKASAGRIQWGKVQPGHAVTILSGGNKCLYLLAGPDPIEVDVDIEARVKAKQAALERLQNGEAQLLALDTEWVSR